MPQQVVQLVEALFSLHCLACLAALAPQQTARELLVVRDGIRPKVTDCDLPSDLPSPQCPGMRCAPDVGATLFVVELNVNN